MKMMQWPIAASNAARREVLSVSRLVCRVRASSIATPNAKGIIGRSTKNDANDVRQSYVTRRSSRPTA